MRIKVNGKGYNVKSLSELSFIEFNKVLIKAKVSGLDEYLSIFLSIEKEDLLNSRIKSHTIDALHAFIFDIDVTSKIKNPPNTIRYNDKVYFLNELELDTFGKAYYYDLYYQRYKAKVINEYELSMYALSIALSPTLDDAIDDIYKELIQSTWHKYLPTAFFLLKKYRKPRKHSVMLLLRFMLALRVTKLKMRHSKKRLTRWAKT